MEETITLKEEWREIYGGIFAVSSMGRVRRLRAPHGRTSPKILKLGRNPNGMDEWKVQAWTADRALADPLPRENR